ncbi:MerR family transcriptional regulator [Dactylosporangium sp. NPDC050688]|uniref:MerR family transcriptional regulator n=1 Tax=Dactylosporangium sp. NPDC050688 TaxID=3157217 RepID=UPI0033E93444
MMIGERAARTGVPQRLLRYYEEQRLITPGRDVNGYRMYCDPGVERVAQIRALLAAGLPTRMIRDLLPCMRGPDPTALDGVDAEFVAALRREAASLGARIDDLTARRTAILEFVDVIAGT